MKEIPLYSGYVPQQAEQIFVQPPRLGGVQGYGDELNSAISTGPDAVVDYAKLHDFGTQQEVAKKRAELEMERDAEWERRSALANGAEGAFWTADGNMNEDALREFAAKYAERDAQIERPYWLKDSALRDEAASNEAMQNLERQTMLMAAREESRRRRDAFTTNLGLAAQKGDWRWGAELVNGAEASGMLSKAEAELARLRLGEQRMRKVGSAVRRGAVPAVNLGGRQYHGVSAALAMQARRDGWKPSVATGGDETRTGEVEPGVEEPLTVSMLKDVSMREGGDGGMLTDPLNFDDAARLPQGAFGALQDDLTYNYAVRSQLGEDGRVHYMSDLNAPLMVRSVVAQAERQGGINPDTARAMVAEITLDSVTQDPEATVEQIMRQFDDAGIYETLGEGDVAVGKVRTQAIVREWRDRGTSGYKNVSAANIERLVDAAVQAPEFGKGQEWRTMELLNPGKKKGDEWEEPDKADNMQEYKKWWTLYKVYKKYRSEYAAYAGEELMDVTDYRDGREEFAERAQGFYRWYMGHKYKSKKDAATKAGKAYYTAAVSEELARHVIIGPDGQLAPQFSSEVGIIKGVLAKPMPDLGVEDAERVAEEQEREHAKILNARRAKARDSFTKLAEYKQAYAKQGKEAEKAARDAEKKTERERLQQLYKMRATPKEAEWEWDNHNSAQGMPPTCTVPKAEYARLLNELGMEEGDDVYLRCNGKKILVLGYNDGDKVQLNGPAVQAVCGKPKKGEIWQLNGSLGYYYEFKKSK